MLNVIQHRALHWVTANNSQRQRQMSIRTNDQTHNDVGRLPNTVTARRQASRLPAAISAQDEEKLMSAPAECSGFGTIPREQ
jgi:hypothetical protein